jgi:branched-chain amino acid transport system permease protein
LGTRMPARARLFLFILVFILIAMPIFIQTTYVIYVVNIGFILAILSTSWDILSGYSGQLSFGHAGFFGAGAYIATLSVVHYDINPWIAMIFGMIGTGIFAFLVGVITLRLKGPYLALMTLALSQVFSIVVIINPDFTRGSLGISGYEGLLDPTNTTGYYYVGLALTVIVMSILYIFGKSKYGVILRSIRDDEVKAKSMGINTTAYKVAVFVLSGGVAGLAVMHYSAMPIAMAMMGGIGTIIGPGVFALIFGVVGELLNEIGTGYNFVVLGLLVILAVIYMPKGLWTRFMLKQSPKGGEKREK